MRRRPPPPLGLDFVAARRPPSLLGWALLAFGVLASIGVLHEYQVLDDRRADEARLLARARRSIDARNGGGETVPSAPLKEAEVKPAVAAARLLGRDWGGLLTELEGAAADPGVALLELEQDAASGSLRLAGEARNLSEVFAFLARLEAGGRVRHARLINYRFRAEDGAGSVVFQLTARWEAGP